MNHAMSPWRRPLSSLPTRLSAKRVALLLPMLAIALAVAVGLVVVRAQPSEVDVFDVRVNQATQADQHEPSLAVNPLDPRIVLVAAKDWRRGPKEVWYYRSTDGGKSWKDGNINSLPSELPNQSDPVVSFDAAGNAFLTLIGYNQNDLTVGGIFVVRSTDAGLTWQRPVLVSANSDTVFNDKEWAAVDRSSNPSTRGTIYVSFTLFTETGPQSERGDIVLSRSTDGGRTFSGRTPVSPPEHDTNQGSYPIVGPRGEVFVLYYRDLDRGGALYVARSTDRGVTFPQVVKAADVARPPSPLPGSGFRLFVLPSLAVDPASGALFATWNDYAAGNSDVKVVSSTDGGTTWTAPSRVNRDAAKGNQFFPAAVAANGALHFLWLDTRDDASNRRYSPYYGRSNDGGRTVAAEFRLSNVLSDPNVGFEGTLIGDYIGLDLSGDGKRVYAAWTDTRRGDQDIFFASFDAAAAAGPPPASPTAQPPRPTAAAQPSPQPLTAFTNQAFRTLWERSDKPVLNSIVRRPWTWGPISFAVAFEPYEQAAEGQREVQYFDKARMELNRAGSGGDSEPFVTNGLLVVELMTGLVQTGEREFAPPKSPSSATVAGDENAPDALTYRSLASVASLSGDKRAADRTGQTTSSVLTRSGVVRDEASRAGIVKMARYETTTGHNIADVFWNYLNSTGPVYISRFGTLRDEPVVQWLSDVGYPVTEPYWTNTRIGGTSKWVLIQAFQRRVLTYVADNPPGWQVEMGNVGRHYFDWRYGNVGDVRR